MDRGEAGNYDAQTESFGAFTLKDIVSKSYSGGGEEDLYLMSIMSDELMET